MFDIRTCNSLANSFRDKPLYFFLQCFCRARTLRVFGFGSVGILSSRGGLPEYTGNSTGNSPGRILACEMLVWNMTASPTDCDDFFQGCGWWCLPKLRRPPPFVQMSQLFTLSLLFSSLSSSSKWFINYDVIWYTIVLYNILEILHNTILYYTILLYTILYYYFVELRSSGMWCLRMWSLIIRPVHLLRVFLLRVLESNFPGDSL